MTVDLSYALDPRSAACPPDVDLRTASPEELHYLCFPGDIVFVVEGADLSARWGWVPVLDFAITLRATVRALAAEPEAKLEFTESDETIRFTREGDRVRVGATYTEAAATADRAELEAAAERFLRTVVDDLTTAHAALAENPYIASRPRFLPRPTG